MPEEAPKCPGCRSGLHEGTHQARSWERAPYGDEFTDELHRCPECGASSLVAFIDRFAGAGEMRVHGPLSMEEAWRSPKLVTEALAGLGARML